MNFVMNYKEETKPMSNKNIHIENIENKDGGTINFYVGDEKDSTKKIVDIAAVDRYSTPLTASVEMSPWGNSCHRVATRITERLNNQTIYQKYLTYKDEKKAKETMSLIVGVLEGIKDEAEVGLRHSAYLIPRCWKLLSNISDDADIVYHDVEDASLRLRFNNNQFDSHSRGTSMPYGYVGKERSPTYTQGIGENIAQIIGAPSQYSNPGRTGVMASKNTKMVKVSSKNKNSMFINSSYRNLFLKLSKKTFSTKEANEIAEKIGIDWNKVGFTIDDFKNGLGVEMEHNNSSNSC